MKQIDPATAAALAAFAAKGGKVTKIETGASNGMTARQWYKAARDSDNRKVEEDIDERFAEREREVAMAYGVAGLNDLREGAARHGRGAMVRR